MEISCQIKEKKDYISYSSGECSVSIEDEHRNYEDLCSHGYSYPICYRMP